MVLIFQYAGGSKVEQYYTVQVATGETALPDFNYLIQYQNNYHAAVMLGIGIIIGCLLAMAFLRRCFFMSVEDLLKCLPMGTIAGLGIQLVLIFTVGLIVNIVRQIHDV